MAIITGHGHVGCYLCTGLSGEKIIFDTGTVFLITIKIFTHEKAGRTYRRY